jgi:hypothetical protein
VAAPQLRARLLLILLMQQQLLLVQRQTQVVRHRPRLWPSSSSSS